MFLRFLLTLELLKCAKVVARRYLFLPGMPCPIWPLRFRVEKTSLGE